MPLLACLALQPDSAGTAPATATGLNRLALAVGQAAQPARTGFAEAALAEMAAIHTTEADRARAEARHKARDRDLLRWASATAAYDTLPENTKVRLEGLKAIHRFASKERSVKKPL